MINSQICLYLIILSFSRVYCQEISEFVLDYIKEIERTTDSRPKTFVIVLPSIFSVLGIVVIVISLLMTVLCVAYCIFLPWAYSLSTVPTTGAPALSESREQGTYVRAEEIVEQE